jgi:hypothetical protein
MIAIESTLRLFVYGLRFEYRAVRVER